MNIIVEKVLDASKEECKQMLKEATSYLVENAKKIGDKVKTEYLPLVGDFVKNLTGEMPGGAFGKEVDMLDMPTLLDFAKKYIVPGSNEVVAMRVKQEDAFFVYLAYSMDRQLLPVSDNKYIILKAQTLAKEVEDLFGESELVILK